MTTTTTRANTDEAAHVLAACEQLAPTITARAPEIETARRLPPDLLDDLVKHVE